jgi:hypothetical protein
MGIGMNDEMFRSVLRVPKPEEERSAERRPSAAMFSGIVRVFVEDGEPDRVVDLGTLAEIEGRGKSRAFNSVVQSLRIALDTTEGSTPERSLSDLARVSVDVGHQVITLVRRTPEETARWIEQEPIRKARAAEALATKALKKTAKEAAAQAE